MLERLVFATTNRCPIECQYCGAECSPRNTQQLSYEDMTSVVNAIYALGRLKVVVFTGGEPLLLRETLLRMIHYCAERGLATRIVTNAYWARTPEKANEMITKLMGMGLTEINISTDDYHQAFIPIENIRNANDACREHGLRCLLGHKLMKGCRLTLEHLEKELGHKLTRFVYDKENPDNDVFLTGYTVPIAPKMHLIPDDDILFPEDDYDWRQPCESVLESIVITSFRELSICCGIIQPTVREIIVGSLDEYPIEELLLRASRDMMVNWLALEGPYGIMQLIQRHNPEIGFRRRYVSKCHLCAEIFTREECRESIKKHMREKVVELSLERALWDYVRSKCPDEFTGFTSNAAV